MHLVEPEAGSHKARMAGRLHRHGASDTERRVGDEPGTATGGPPASEIVQGNQGKGKGMVEPQQYQKMKHIHKFVGNTVMLLEDCTCPDQNQAQIYDFKKVIIETI